MQHTAIRSSNEIRWPGDSSCQAALHVARPTPCAHLVRKLWANYSNYVDQSTKLVIIMMPIRIPLHHDKHTTPQTVDLSFSTVSMAMSQSAMKYMLVQ